MHTWKKVKWDNTVSICAKCACVRDSWIKYAGNHKFAYAPNMEVYKFRPTGLVFKNPKCK